MSQTPPAPQPARRAGLLIGFFSRWPLPALYLLSDLLFVLLYRIAGYQRPLLIANLKRAFPQKDDPEIKRLAAQSYRNALDFLFETLKAWRLDKVDLAGRVQLHNPQALSRILETHRSVLALTSHSGNWEWLQLACAAQFDAPIAALYSPLNHPGIDQRLQLMRARFDTTLIEAKQALPQLIEFTRKGGIVALNADQLPRPEEEKYWSTFLGQDTAFFAGPARLARLFKMPVVFVHMKRLGRGRYRVEFEPLAEPPYAHDDDVMQAYIKAVERQIEAQPQDWFWLYKRWKYDRPVYAD